MKCQTSGAGGGGGVSQAADGVVSGVVPGSTSGAGGGGGGSLAAAGVTIFVSAPSPAGGGRGGDYSEEEPMDLDSLFSPATSAIASTL